VAQQPCLRQVRMRLLYVRWGDGLRICIVSMCVHASSNVVRGPWQRDPHKCQIWQVSLMRATTATIIKGDAVAVEPPPRSIVPCGCRIWRRFHGVNGRLQWSGYGCALDQLVCNSAGLTSAVRWRRTAVTRSQGIHSVGTHLCTFRILQALYYSTGLTYGLREGRGPLAKLSNPPVGLVRLAWWVCGTRWPAGTSSTGREGARRPRIRYPDLPTFRFSRSKKNACEGRRDRISVLQ
jgi:hypothetical protein